MNAKSYLIVVSLLLTVIVLTACGGGATTPAPQAIAATAVVAGPTIPSGSSYLPPANQMIIKDATLEMLVDDVDIAVTQITQMTSDNGGYLISSQTWLVGESRNATLQLGIPSARFEVALNTVKTFAAQVLKETTSGQDVSAEYTDLQSRLVNLEATAARVREFLDDAVTVEESLRINAELSTLEGQIEQVKGQMNFYEGRAAYSTMNITLRQKTNAVIPQVPGWDPATTVGRAFKVLTTLAQVGLDLLIWLTILGGPFALAGGLALAGLRLAFRKRRPG